SGGRAEQAPAQAAGEQDGALQAVQRWMVELVGRELKIEAERIELDRPLPDYGVDSIMLVQLLRPVSERVGEAVDPSILFEHATIEQFSRWLLSRYGEALALGAGEPVRAEGAESAPPESTESAPPEEAMRAVAAGLTAGPLARSEWGGGMQIAVVGMSCRFAAAQDLQEYWRLLAEGRSAIRPVPPQRWGQASEYCAGVLQEASWFDPQFFLISPADARAMDPQALLVLEQALGLWYHGGYSLQEIKGRPIGVYLGGRSQVVADEQALAGAQNLMLAVGANYLAANISRFFDLRGPSVVLDTACSSALVAMNMAIQGLQGGEIESALVGGVSLLNGDGALRLFERRGILRREPSLHLFDGRANGTILGEGAGLVWLKGLEQALRDGDAIYGLVQGIAINNDGRTAGPAAPNLQAHKSVMQQALARSGKQAQEIEHVEVNGSGTEVTDLLELKAIESVYRPSSAQPCELGSMKPNIGHPLCAEGMASFIKVVLMLHHRQRVPFLSALEPMRHYDLAASPFRFTRALSAVGDVPTVAAINCFADGGTNAHLIVQGWHEREPRPNVRRPQPPPILHRINCQPHGQPGSAIATRRIPTRPAAVERGDAATRTRSIWGAIVSVESASESCTDTESA
ncbi:MAG: beta-ketoacyl synthase N-terminal-like domain-containing protein, partial [Steroidobacteraceae bacterium]